MYGRGPKKLAPETVPMMPGARPDPVATASPHGTIPVVKLAAFWKLVALTIGPCGTAVSVKFALTDE